MKIKKTLSLIIIMSLMISSTACTMNPKNLENKNSSDTTTSAPTVTSQISSEMSSEYPSSDTTISSHESSSTVSEIVSEISSAQSSAPKKPVISAPKPPSSSTPKPPVSSAPKPPASSTPPPSSEPPASSAPVVTPPPANNVTHAQMKAVWISFLEFDSFIGSSESAFRSKMASYYDNIVGKGLNTVLVQIRPHGDSMYESAYYPWSKHVSGTMGVGVSYDPVEIMVSEAHARGLEFHAWINPYRTMTDTEFQSVPDTFLTKQWYNSPNRDQYMVKCSDGRWWLKPGNNEAVQLIINGSNEIVTRYAVDGVHIDDYFYGADPSLYGDSKQSAKANTTRLVKGLYDGIKSVRSSVRFGVSPLGGFNATNSLPNSDLNYLSTDLNLWCKQNGYIDYIIPQIYWEYNHKTQPFTTTLNKWQDFVTASNVGLYVGLAPYKKELPTDMIKSQMNDSISGYRSSGYALFRYDHILGL